MTDWTGLAAAVAAILGTFALLIVLVWQIGSTIRIRTLASRDKAGMRLSEEAAMSQQQMAAELAEMRERMTAIEKLLRDVG